MTEEEKAEKETEEEEEQEMEVWSIEDLIAMTDTVQQGKIDYRGKVLKFQYCELVEAEEPKIKTLRENAKDADKQDYYQKLGNERICKMIEKANKKQPESATLYKESWMLLPTTLKFKISNHIMGIESEGTENFTI